VELLGLLGWYRTIAWMINVNRTALNPGMAPPLRSVPRPLP
jgi:hypothetical protein